MYEKVELKEVMTTRAAMEKYRTQYFIMAITDVVDQGDNDLGYVLYIADDKRDLLKVDRSLYQNKRVGLMQGIAAEPYPQIGNIVCYE